MHDAILIDQAFLSRKAEEAMAQYREIYPERELPAADLISLLTFLADYLRLSKEVTAFVYGPEGVLPLFTDVEELQLPEGRAVAIAHQWTADPAAAITKDLEAHRESWERVVLIADDDRYGLLIDDPHAVDVLIRLGNDETAMVDFGDVRWQDLGYVVGYTMGLETHEL